MHAFNYGLKKMELRVIYWIFYETEIALFAEIVRLDQWECRLSEISSLAESKTIQGWNSKYQEVENARQGPGIKLSITFSVQTKYLKTKHP
jgi:hypothetical protein